MDDGEREETWVRVSVGVVGTPCCGRGDGGGRGWVRAGAYLACSSMRENTLGANMLPPPAAPSASSFPAVIFPPGPREVVCAQRSCFVELVIRWKKAKRSLSLSQKTRERRGRGTMSSKRNNSQLDRSYKKARGIKDDARGPKVDPTTILNIAFMAIGLKALNEHVKQTHGINVFQHGKRLVVGAIRDVRSAVSRMLAPKSGGGKGDRGRPNSRNFKGKGKRLGKN